ncbi:MAG: aquaporin [Candidatus Micrarchaeota archaeon]
MITLDYRKYLAEFLGTFALVFIGMSAVSINLATNGTALGLVGIALAHGLVLMTMIYALSHISGAHFNPSITIAMAATKKIDLKTTVAYIISQLLGAIVAGFLVYTIFLQVSSGAVSKQVVYGFNSDMPLVTGLLVEGVLTFFLALAVFGSTDKKAPAGFYGIAIGLVLTFDILVGGLISGAAMNPARWFGPAIATQTFLVNQLAYVVGPIVGALVAGLLYEYGLKEKEEKKTKKE